MRRATNVKTIAAKRRVARSKSKAPAQPRSRSSSKTPVSSRSRSGVAPLVRTNSLPPTPKDIIGRNVTPGNPSKIPSRLNTDSDEIQILENDTVMTACCETKKKTKRSRQPKTQSEKTKIPAKQAKTTQFYEVIQVSGSESEESSDDECDGDTVASYDKMFRMIGRQIGHQRISTTVRNTIVTLPSSSDDDDDSLPRRATKPTPKVISKEEEERNARRLQTEKEIEELLNFNTPPRKAVKLQNQNVPLPVTVSDVENDDDDGLPVILPLIPYCIRIHYKAQLIVFKLVESDYCFEIRRNLAERVKEKPENLRIFFEDNLNLFQDELTLKQAGIKVGTMLEAFRITTPPGGTKNSKPKPIKDPNLIRIKIQSNERRSGAYYEMRKTDKFCQLQLVYAKKNNVSPSQVKFKFDGDVVSMEDTPCGLDLEGDEVFDVFVSS